MASWEGGARVRSRWRGENGEPSYRWLLESDCYAVLSHRLGGFDGNLVLITAGETNKRILLAVTGWCRPIATDGMDANACRR